jgi:hypothetical protein
MKYMLLIYLDENGLSPSEREQCYSESAQFAQKLSTSGKYLDAAPLHPMSTATSVRVREQLGGYFLIDATNLDEAIGIAAKIPGGKWGTVEIRPVMEIQGLPAD